MNFSFRSLLTAAGLVLAFTLQGIGAGALRGGTAAASSELAGFKAEGALDGDRFSESSGHCWKGESGAGTWTWMVHFNQPRQIGAILQVVGDHSFVLRHAPKDYVWQWSENGSDWQDFSEAKQADERRTYRIHRLKKARTCRFMRMQIRSASGDFPTLREVEFFDSPRARIDFPQWLIAVDTTEKEKLPGHGQEFIPLAQSCPGWETLQAQQVWLGSFDEDFVKAEPRPLCAFLSGNFKDWCEVSREPWRGTAAILKRKRLPMWASCGGAQGLAILAETGVDHPWDCPHCRDPKAPKSPIYTHIGHTGSRPCGDYSACVFERGPHQIKQLGQDPAFVGLPEEFTAMESHCGQIAWAPKGWSLIATAGQGSLTKTQCLRMNGHPIYAAQFHIEMGGTPDNSRRIMGNFLNAARAFTIKR